MTTETAHTSTPNASRCSCGMLWLDHCDNLSIKVENLTKALKGIYHLALEMKGTRYLSMEERQAVEFAKETLSKALSRSC